ncbi:MAG: indolepyruvate ferredoxin oxidoreductase family protein [bacterium]
MPAEISLDDKYALDAKRAYLSGIEALVRLPLVQHQRDLEAGLDTAGFISGYRGSPLGTLDQSLWRAHAHLARHNIRFQPGVNEDLAATAVWGTQQAHLLPGARHDGVFAMWYGKGPGVDRSMDAIKHANAFGTTRHGGVLAVAGDDHACKSSTVPHQSEHMFVGAAVPVLNPANVQEVLDFGLHGWALSRYSGCWVALKAITESMDSALSADTDPHRVRIRLPDDFEPPPGGLNAQWPTTPLAQEALLHKYRIYAARAYARANDLNRVTLDPAEPRLGIVTSGKSHLDVMEALDDLGINQDTAARIGIRIYKVGMSWPLEPVATHAFAKGLHEILVVEEKRSILQNQITEQLYNWPVAERPVVVGEFDEHGRDLVTNLGELTPAMVACAIGARVMRFYDSDAIRRRLEFLDAKERRLARAFDAPTRTPYFCSGCPHNTSTRVPDGSFGMAGIGCHYMVKWMHRRTETFTQMGGEGASWIGIAPFTDTAHVFQNIGDGTYFHSGLLAIRAAVAAEVNITYKVLLNDAVAMTGGQPVDGALSLSQLAAQLQAEGVAPINVVAEDVAGARKRLSGVRGIEVLPRREFEKLQRAMREVRGVSAIIYDQTCAAEKRRRRKRGEMPQAAKRVFINAAVCEGCGDCSVTSNCLSVLPKKTELGIKRQIDQSACNADYSCLDGFCPSFVTVTGATMHPVAERERIDRERIDAPPPEVAPARLQRPWNVLVAGIGGTGVLTVGSLLAMAAHIEGKGCSTLNQTGLAQKFGAVVSHVRIAARQDEIHAVRIPEGGADVLLGCDLVVSAMPDALARLDPARSHCVVNTHENPTADFIRDRDYEFPGARMRQLLRDESGAERTDFLDATRIAHALLGDSIGANLLLLGFAHQRGLIPVGAAAINRAIELNAVAVAFNQQAFAWGRRAAVDLAAVEKLAGGDDARDDIGANDDDDARNDSPARELDALIESRCRYLTAYQNEKYARKYRAMVERARRFDLDLNAAHDGEHGAHAPTLTEAVARNYFKLMAYKDEYEVARLYSDGDFERELKRQFAGPFKLRFHLAPPLFARKDAVTGHPLKREFPGATLTLFRYLARMKFLRGTPLDPFGHARERKLERQLITEYEADLTQLLRATTARNYEAAVALADLPEMIKGFGHVKAAAVAEYRKRREAMLAKFNAR